MKIKVTFPEASLRSKNTFTIKRRNFSVFFRNYKELALNTATFLSFFAFTYLTLTGLQIFNPETYADTDIAAVITQTNYYITATSDSLNGAINMNVNSTPSGTMAVAKDTINVKSNVPNGYNVYVSMKRNDGCTSNCNALKKEGSSAYIPSTTGTFASPTTLSANTWGYAIRKGSTGAPSNNFNTSYNTSVPDSSNVFAALPTKGNDQLIQTISSPNSTDGVDAEIYYGLNINTAKESGVYRGEITYTIAARDASGVAEIANVTPDITDKLEGGEVLTIGTNYTFTPANAGTVKVYINSLTASKECTNVTKTTVSGTLQLTCIAPAFDTGKYDVRVVISNYGKDITMTRAITYIVNSADAKNLRNAVRTGFDSDTLTSTVDSNYYAGDSLPLSDVVDVYTQQYDGDKTNAQNTQDAGIRWDDSGENIIIEPGYHDQQTVPAKIDYSDVTDPHMAMYTPLNVYQTWHLWCNADQGDSESYQRSSVTTTSQTVTVQGSNIKTVSIAPLTKTYGAYTSGGTASFTLTGVRASDNATATIASFANESAWPTTTTNYSVTSYKSVTYRFSISGVVRSRWPAGCDYDVYSTTSAGTEFGVLTYVP